MRRATVAPLNQWIFISVWNMTPYFHLPSQYKKIVTYLNAEGKLALRPSSRFCGHQWNFRHTMGTILSVITFYKTVHYSRKTVSVILKHWFFLILSFNFWTSSSVIIDSHPLFPSVWTLVHPFQNGRHYFQTALSLIMFFSRLHKICYWCLFLYSSLPTNNE